MPSTISHNASYYLGDLCIFPMCKQAQGHCWNGAKWDMVKYLFFVNISPIRFMFKLSCNWYRAFMSNNIVWQYEVLFPLNKPPKAGYKAGLQFPKRNICVGLRPHKLIISLD